VTVPPDCQDEDDGWKCRLDPQYVKLADLEERVARAIDPRDWGFIDRHKRDDPPHPEVEPARQESLARARRALEVMRN
jgi:hypothetical protein